MKTILDAKEAIFDHLIDHGAIKLDSDINKIIGKSKTPEISKACVRLALNQLKSDGILLSEDENIFVLDKAAEKFPQTVSITGATAVNIATFVNEFLRNMGANPSVDPFSITEDDVASLLQISKLALETDGEEIEA